MDDHQYPAWMISRGRSLIQFQFFLSHVSEDNDDALELKRQIADVSRRRQREPGRGLRLDSFLDEHNWRFGQPNTEVIRDHLLASEHMILWVTPNYLRAVRGWTWVELAFAELIQLRHQINSYRNGEPSYPFIYPVFRDVAIEDIQRTPLLNYWEQQVWPPAGSDSIIRRIARRLVDQYWSLRAEPRSRS